MAGNEWKRVAESAGVKEGSPVTAELSEEESVLLIRRGGKLLAWRNECPHVGCPLGYGDFDGDLLTCPCHNARFDLGTGKMLSPPALDDLASYKVKEEAGAVYVGERLDPRIAMPQGTDERTVAIVGTGAAGSAAAEQLRREGFAGRIVLIGPEEDLPYDRTLLSKFFLASEMGVGDITLRDTTFYDGLRIELRLGVAAEALDPGNKTITLSDGESLRADMILLATGSKPNPLPVPGAELDNCFTLRKPGDALAIRRVAEGAKRAVVVGASFIGTEVAAYLRNRGLEVTVVAPEQVPFERVLGRRAGSRFVTLHKSQGIRYQLGKGVANIKGTGKVEAVELSDGTELPADLVVAGVGVTPVTDYLEGSGLVKNGSVPVNARLESEVPGIFAAGDIAAVDDGRRTARVEHWVVAQRHGVHAAKAMLGSSEPLGYIPFFWTRQFETSFVYIGFAPEFDEVWELGDVESGEFLLGYAEDGALRAVGTMGMSGKAIALGKRLEAGEEIDKSAFAGS